MDLGERVIVVGGGSSATDAARSALRQGAKEVSILYRRTRAEMPAADEEVEQSTEEGVSITFLVSPVRITRQNGHLVAKCVRMQQGSVDSSGRRRPVPIEDSEFEVEADTLIMAVGQAPEAVPGVETDRRGRVAVDEDTLQTARPGVFAAGDVVTGPSSVIEAIAAGRLSAQSIDRYLGGEGNIDEVFAPAQEEPPAPVTEENQEARRRVPIPMRPVSERIAGGGDVELTYPEESAIAEAERCLRCDLEEDEEETGVEEEEPAQGLTPVQ